MVGAAVASAHVVIQKKRSIRVGTVVGEMTATKQHTAPEGEEHKKCKSLKKSHPYSPGTYCGHTRRFEKALG
jgi:hypothetical protein